MVTYLKMILPPIYFRAWQYVTDIFSQETGLTVTERQLREEFARFKGLHRSKAKVRASKLSNWTIPIQLVVCTEIHEYVFLQMVDKCFSCYQWRLKNLLSIPITITRVYAYTTSTLIRNVFVIMYLNT